MNHKNSNDQEQRTAELARKFIEKEMVAEPIQSEAIQHLEGEEPIRALDIILDDR